MHQAKRGDTIFSLPSCSLDADFSTQSREPEEEFGKKLIFASWGFIVHCPRAYSEVESAQQVFGVPAPATQW